MTQDLWRPGASLDVLKKIALLRSCIRHYMQEQGVLEVVTPALSIAGTTDPNIHSFPVANQFLHTSPEFPMKRLLAAYETDIYQVASVFRDGEAGRYHNAEFSLLEWYRIGMDHVALMDDVSALMKSIMQLFDMPWVAPVKVRYTDAVSNVCEKPFAQLSVVDIERVFDQHARSYPKAIGDDLDAAMDLLMDEFVVSEFAEDRATFVTEYPASQAALARITIDDDNIRIAERFEMYWGSVELANGFHELADASEQRERFEHEQRIRIDRGQKSVPIDHHLIAALTHGLPNCAGVAIGLDRLMLLLSGTDHIDAVQAFSSRRA